MYKYDAETNVVKDSFRYSHLRYCVFCDTIKDRDNNASINIGNLQIYQQMKLPRPSHFTSAGNRKHFNFEVLSFIFFIKVFFLKRLK